MPTPAEIEDMKTVFSRFGVPMPRIETIAEDQERCKIHNCVLPCPVCLGQEEQKRRRIEYLRKNSGLDERFIKTRFENYIPTCEAAASVKLKCESYAGNFKERLKSCDCMMMVGPCGTGKSMLAACVSHGVMDHGYSTLTTTAMDIMLHIKDSWHRESESSQLKIMQRYYAPTLLTIDEIGKHFGSQTEKMLLEEIIATRHNKGKPTIMISNMPYSQVADYVGARVIDRFQEGNSEMLNFVWGSYRRKR